MTVRIDPEENETRVLFDFADFEGKHVLEVGSGDGRLTWLYADRTAQVTAVEPFTRSFDVAVKDFPDRLKGKVEFQNASFENFAATSVSSSFDVVLLSWSLC